MNDLKILIVDDSHLFADFLLNVVTKRGYAGITASNGKEALDILKSSTFNLIILDLELPDIHGNEVLKIIRSNSQFNDVAVIVVSGTNDPDKIIISLELGANDFISKPFNEMMLGLKIKNLLMLQKSTLLLKDEINLHKATMDELTHSRNDLETVFQNSPIAMIIVDENIKIIKRNHAANEFFKANAYEAKELDPGEFIHCINMHMHHMECGKTEMCKTCQFRNILHETISTNQNIHQRESNIQIATNAGTKALSLYISSILIQIEKKPHILLCIEDVTERLKIINDLKLMITSKEKLLSVMAHDLKNPFTVLLGMSEMLIKKLENNEYDKVKTYAEYIHQTSDQTYNLLENLLNWMRAQTGKLIPQKKVFFLEDIFSKISQNFSTILEGKKLKLTAQIPNTLAAYADENMTLTVIRNLLSNAIKFSHSGHSISICALEKNNQIEVCISDTGTGIPKETLPKLFKAEINISTTGTAEEQGSGFGLMVCKEFIELHKGEIWVESEINQGSSFYFTLQKADTANN